MPRQLRKNQRRNISIQKQQQQKNKQQRLQDDADSISVASTDDGNDLSEKLDEINYYISTTTVATSRIDGAEIAGFEPNDDSQTPLSPADMNDDQQQQLAAAAAVNSPSKSIAIGEISDQQRSVRNFSDNREGDSESVKTGSNQSKVNVSIDNSKDDGVDQRSSSRETAAIEEEAEVGQSSTQNAVDQRALPQKVDDQRSSPSKSDDQRSSPPKSDVQRSSPPRSDEQRSSPQKIDEQRSSPQKIDDQRSSPPKSDDHRSSPQKIDDQRSSPSKSYDQISFPPKSDDQRSSPPKSDDQRSSPLKIDDQRSSPQKIDNQRSSLQNLADGRSSVASITAIPQDVEIKRSSTQHENFLLQRSPSLNPLVEPISPQSIQSDQITSDNVNFDDHDTSSETASTATLIRSRSVSFSDASDTSTLKDEETACNRSAPVASSSIPPQSSPDREISRNQNIVDDLTTNSDASNLLICDRTNETIIQDINVEYQDEDRSLVECDSELSTGELGDNEISQSETLASDIPNNSSDSLHDQLISELDSGPLSPSRPIRHPIVQEVITILYPSRVESPKPIRSKRSGPLGKSRSLDEDDIMIQEMSDTSSAGDLTDNQPVVSEASESEADPETLAEIITPQQLDSRILSIQTLPFEQQDEKDLTENGSSSPNEAKGRRARNRAALEMHFFPQFLNPRYLDSIKEESSDASDTSTGHRSPIRSRTKSLNDLEDDVFLPANDKRSSTKAAADAVFPKSHLDFSQRRRHSSGLRPPPDSVIREESPCLIVETKIIEPPEVVEESCSEWKTATYAQSLDAPELIYIDSASSSSSDLREFEDIAADSMQLIDPDSANESVHIETPTIEMNEAAKNIFRGTDSSEVTPTRELAPEPTKTSGPSHDQQQQNDQHPELKQQQQPVSGGIGATTATTGISISAADFAESLQAATAVMASLSERLSCSSQSIIAGQSAVDRESVTNSEQSITRPDFKIGEVCSSSSMLSSLNPSINGPNINHSGDSVRAGSSESNSAAQGEFVRQDSAGSHGSAQSQNTVINRGPPSHCDLADFDIGPCVSGSSNEFGESEAPDSPSTLRQLCLERLAHLPYGEAILEELATVSESIGELTQKHQQIQQERIQQQVVDDMPYPLPEVPQIDDLVVPQRPDLPSQVKLMTAPPRTKKLTSPPPPPIPIRPKIESWLGVPTDQDPNVLVCLSPAQREYINQQPKSQPDPTPDSLLDMHRKFVERRGYHELSPEEVRRIHREKSEKVEHIVSSTQLRQSASPPPIPPPPAAELLLTESDVVPKAAATHTFTNLLNNRSDLGRDISSPQNHRLLAIIRDTQHQSIAGDSQTTRDQVETSDKVKCTVETAAARNGANREYPTIEPPAVPPRSSKPDIKSPATAPSTPGSILSDMSSTMSHGAMPSSSSSWYHDPFDFGSSDFRKRFSNIETSTSPTSAPFCSQLMRNHPKRFSNIETSTISSKKRVENGNVVYDITDRNKEKFSTSADKENPFINGFADSAKFDLDAEIFPKFSKPAESQMTGTKPDAITTTTTSSTSSHQSNKTSSQIFENRSNAADATTKQQSDNNFAYDEFRQRAKESAQQAKSEFLEKQNFLLKDFDELTKLIKDDFLMDGMESSTETTEKSRTKETRNYSTSKGSETNVHTIPILIEDGFIRKGQTDSKETRESKIFNVPIRIEGDRPRERQEPPRSRIIPIRVEAGGHENPRNELPKEEAPRFRTIPIQMEAPPKPRATTPGPYPYSHLQSQRDRHYSERRLSSRNLDEWMRYIEELGSSENITKPIQREVEICTFGRSSNIRAPRLNSPPPSNGNLSNSRLSQSTNNLSTVGSHEDRYHSSHQYTRNNSSIDTTPILQHASPRNVRQASAPREIPTNEFETYRQQEMDRVRTEFDQLEADRRRLIEEIDQMHHMNRLRKDSYQYRSARLPTLTEEEAFRQQMHNEWLDKVAEREERRLHKIIKISGTPEDLAQTVPQVPPRNLQKSGAKSGVNISDEFLRRVKERRTKLCMPSDSDWESGAESQPVPRLIKDNTPPNVKVIEGQSERDFKNLPPHLREFAKITKEIVESRHEESEVGNATAIRQQQQPQPELIETQRSPSTISVQHQKKDTDKGSSHHQHNKSQGPTSSTKIPTTTTTKPTTKTVATILRKSKIDEIQTRQKITKRKETRFKLTPNRRSWSETDLLREIDNALVLSKGFLFRKESQPVFAPKFNAREQAAANQSVWNGNDQNHSNKNGSSATCDGPPLPPPPPVWSPRSSPSPYRKEFRPVKFESPNLPRKYTTQRHDSAPVAPPWSNGSKPLESTQSSSCSNLTNTGTVQLVLRKFNSGNIPARPAAKDQRPAFVRPNEVIYQLKGEYMSEPETEDGRPRKMAQLGRRKFDGIGPTTRDGMPIVLRSEVKEPNQHQWYKRMYNTLHKVPNDDGYVTIRYKTHRGRYPFKANGYMSEPEPNYDSDYSTMKYQSLDRRRIPSTGSYHDDRSYGPVPNPIRSAPLVYRNQPGRIENYVPGHSSVSEKEKKEWWDEVMDIFDGWIDENSPLPLYYVKFAREVRNFQLEQQKLSGNYTEGYLSKALKEDGYESDSNLIFRKRQDAQFSQLSPIEQKQAYRSVQAGGEPPLQGFRKAAPEKPKDDEDIEYYPITPTLTKIRVHTAKTVKTPMPQLPPPPPPPLPPQSRHDVICYPVTNVTRPLDLFAPFPKNVPSFIPVNPPAPPCRRSSRTNTALKVVSTHYSKAAAAARSSSTKPTDARHEACFKSDYYHEAPAGGTSKFGTITIRKHSTREPIVRSKSAGTVSSTSSRLATTSIFRENKDSAGSRISRRQHLIRVSSVSPARISPRTADLRKSSPSPVAFGRSISKERMFAEEKKRLEQTLPLCRKSFTASTNILKDPSLKSPEEVKKAVRSSYTRTVTTAPKRLPAGSRSASFMGSVTRKNIGPGRREENTMKVSVSHLTKGHESRKDAVRTPVVTKTTLHSTKTVENKTPKQTTKASSTLSLARTSSTFSVDSTGSRKKDSKKPVTITGLINTDSPRTISGRSKKRKSPPKQVVETKKVLKRSESLRVDGRQAKAELLRRQVNNSIIEHQEAVRSDNFFQNLFLRDLSPGASITSSAAQPSTSVLEKAHYWNVISAKSEPSLRRPNVYLSQKKPVSDSKFLSLERKYVHKSRSLSPSYRRLSPMGPRVLEQVSKFDSIDQLSEAESEFDDPKRGRTEELVYKFEQRSSSEPRTRTYYTEISRPDSPLVIHGRQTVEYSRSASPVTREVIRPPTREVRSPSRRRIDSFRGGPRSETRRIIRASSLSSADDRYNRRLYATSEISQSTGSLNVIERHAPVCKHRVSDRFKELNRFYKNLERIGQLERATSSTDLHPIRKEGELIDFDLWKRVRAHQKAERELDHLVDKLKQDQRDRDLLFRPKDVADLKWNLRADSGLRCKEKSVENIKDAFERKAQGDESLDLRQVEIESLKDIYKPYWRGSSVAEHASNMVVKYNTQPRAGRQRTFGEPRVFLSNNLISTLSRDQVAKIKDQLNEIYSNSPGPSSPSKGKCEVKEDYVITVENPAKNRVGSLKVRCNSSISKEDLLGPILRKKEAQIRAMRNESFERHLSPSRPAKGQTIEQISREVTTSTGSGLSEVEKKRISLSISREIQDKVLERRGRAHSPVLLAKETRGAIAAENAKKTLPDPVPKEFVSIEYSSQKQEHSRDNSLDKVSDRKTVRVRRSSFGESESTSDISKTTVIFKGQKPDGILPKIKYFEEKKKEEPPKTIYHAREDSSPDEEEVLKAIEEKMKTRQQESREHATITLHRELSSSASDFKELFGERGNFPAPPPPPPPDEQHQAFIRQSRYRSSSLTLSNASSYETIYRSRSISPIFYGRHQYHHPRSSYLSLVRTGDVRKITDKFETLNSPRRSNFFELSPPRRIRSDPELRVLREGKSNSNRITVRGHESGDVSWITHKFEMRNSAGAGRGRSRTRSKPTSPIPRIPLRKEDRLMPRIDIISKTALLKEDMIRNRSPVRSRTIEVVQSGEVERIRNKFESSSPERTTSLLGQMYTSSPDISELRDISSYLSASWVAHRYPKRGDNARSSICPERGPENELVRRRVAPRPNSTSPPRTKSLVASILKPYYDVFADQKFDPLIHRPISRYVPDGDDGGSSGSGRNRIWENVRNGFKRTAAVKFKEVDVGVPPPPPPPPSFKSLSMNQSYENGYNYREESPRRYVEGDVNIHYKTPIRYEYKDALADEEIIRKQSETAKKLYQEERRRKYLQELQDMNSRRHADNLLPTQKSPIPLNRYDDFPTDVSPKSPGTGAYVSFPHTVARALYNFQGQTARELTFKKGDVIYIRRQIDKNWYEGEHNAMVGLLPVNYVEIITKDGTRSQPAKKPSEGQARAKFNFQAQSALELSLNKGELVTLTRRVDANWFEGRIANRKGIFPVSYVDVLTDIGADDANHLKQTARNLMAANNTSPTLDQLRTSLNNEFNHVTNGGQHPNGILRETKTVHKTEVLHVDTNSDPVAYRALYKYRPQNNDELELQEGDIIYVLEKCDDGWYVGTSQRTGCFGTFPGNYVERA